MPEDPSYFFDHGLRFECTQCGQCCTGASGQVLVSAEEILTIEGVTGWPSHTFLRDVPDGKSLTERANGDCVFFRNQRCSIHAVKPQQCRTFPFWFKNLRNEDAWQKTIEECEGIGRGRLYTKDEILQILHEDIEIKDVQ
jgi:Fe-S-cluster containining protein